MAGEATAKPGHCDVAAHSSRKNRRWAASPSMRHDLHVELRIAALDGRDGHLDVKLLATAHHRARHRRSDRWLKILWTGHRVRLVAVGVRHPVGDLFSDMVSGDHV